MQLEYLTYSIAPVRMVFMLSIWCHNQADYSIVWRIFTSCWCKIPIIFQSLIECFFFNSWIFIWLVFRIINFEIQFDIFYLFCYIFKAFNWFVSLKWNSYKSHSYTNGSLSQLICRHKVSLLLHEIVNYTIWMQKIQWR